MSTQRLIQLQAILKKSDVSQIIISDPYSIAYLLDDYFIDPGERLYALLVNTNKAYLFLNALFTPFNKSDFSPLIKQIIYQDGENIWPELINLLNDNTVGIDKIWPSHFLIDLLTLKPQINVVHGSHFIDQLRAIKSPQEIEYMKQASYINDLAMEELIKLIPNRLSEIDMANELTQIYQTLGADGFAFDPIIAYGAHASDPHHINSKQLVTEGDSIILDIGCMYQHYASDMTRTVFYKKVPKLAESIYKLVKEANNRAIELIKPGIKFSEIDFAARDYITQAGYGNYFIHRTGHFIGRQTHEPGDVSPYNHNILQAGQVFSIEPGIYLPGQFGVRIEDLVLVTDSGYELLNHYPKDLIVIK